MAIRNFETARLGISKFENSFWNFSKRFLKKYFLPITTYMYERWDQFKSITNFYRLLPVRGDASNCNQKVFAAANYVTKSDWSAALHSNVSAATPLISSVNFLVLLIASIKLKSKYFYCSRVLKFNIYTVLHVLLFLQFYYRKSRTCRTVELFYIFQKPRPL